MNNDNPYGIEASNQYALWEERFQPKEDIETLNLREKMAKKLGASTLIYAVFSTFCLYDNLSGITMPLFGIATLIYMIYGLRQNGVVIKRLSWYYGAVIMSLAVSDFLTGNPTIIFFNNVGIVMMIFIFLLHNVYDDSRWNFGKTAKSVIESFFLSIGALDDFRKDMAVLKQRTSVAPISGEKKRIIKYVFIGLVISVPVVGFLVMLLCSADLVFSNMFGTVMERLFSAELDLSIGIGITITFLVIFFAAYCIMRFFSYKKISEEVYTNRNLEPIIAITVLSMISVVYIMFSVIQFVYLFRGEGTPPGGYTYSHYAREGFFQLLTVSIINFLMVLFVNNRFRESLVLKILMTIISLCTYIMIASSYFRIKMYIDAYLLTALRIWVLWGLAVLSLLFAAVIISIYKHDFPLFRYSIIVVSVLYILIGYIRMDYVIADYNLSHVNTENSFVTEDDDYLVTLSTDAALVIYQYGGDLAERYFSNIQHFDKNRSWRQFNLSAYTANMLADD